MTSDDNTAALSASLGLNVQTPTRLDGERWSFAANHRGTWIVLATPKGPRGVELRRAGDDVVAFSVGDCIVFLAARTTEVFCVRVERANDTDPTIADAWIAAQGESR